MFTETCTWMSTTVLLHNRKEAEINQMYKWQTVKSGIAIQWNSKEQSRDTFYNTDESIKYARKRGNKKQTTSCSPSVREIKTRQIHRTRKISHCHGQASLGYTEQTCCENNSNDNNNGKMLPDRKWRPLNSRCDRTIEQKTPE